MIKKAEQRRPVTHIIGAGLSGLSAAVRIASAGHAVQVHEATSQAGGRCRSYYDAAMGSIIDNGNHLLLSGNHAALDYLKCIGAEDKISGPPRAEFVFADMAAGERWTLKLNRGRFPVWLFDRTRRVPGTRPADYLSAASLLWAGRKKRVCDVLRPGSALYTRLWHPLMLAALNTHPKEASARLAGAILRNTLAKGGEACRPLVAAAGLSAAFVDPALSFLKIGGNDVRFGHRLRGIDTGTDCVSALDFGNGDRIELDQNSRVILAVPPWVAASLLPGLETPTEFRAIVNGHFRIQPPVDLPEIIGVINATVEWIFAFPGRVSITISGADRLIEKDREELAVELWREVSAITGLPRELPPWQIVKEKRATFAASPGQDAMRPDNKTKWRNLFLAGDWIQTGLPATIEGAIRSGERAARLAIRGH